MLKAFALLIARVLFALRCAPMFLRRHVWPLVFALLLSLLVGAVTLLAVIMAAPKPLTSDADASPLGTFISANGTTANGWSVAGASGPQIVNDGGVLEGRNAAASALVNVRGADPSVAADLVTLGYANSHYSEGGAITLTGDLAGSGAATIDASVVRLEGYPLSTTAPTGAALLAWDGGVWGPTNAPQNLATVTFAAEVNNNDAGPSDAAAPFVINWTAGQKQEVFLTGNATFSFTAPPGPANLILRVIQSGAGGNLVTWPAAVKWVNSTPPTLSTTTNAIDIVAFYYNGTNYFGVLSPNFGWNGDITGPASRYAANDNATRKAAGL